MSISITKILTDQPASERRVITRNVLASPSPPNVFYAPYFSIPIQNEDTAIIDPLNPNRELRPGEMFIASQIQVINRSATTRTFSMWSTHGATDLLIAPAIPIPAGETLLLPPGLSAITTVDAGGFDDLQGFYFSASAANSLTFICAVIVREWITHAPDSTA